MSFVFFPSYSSFILFFSAYFDVVIFWCCFWLSFRPQAGSCQEFFVFVFFLFCFVLCLYSPGASWLHGSAARCCLPLFGSSAVLRSRAGRRARATGSAGPGEPRHLPFVMLRPVFAFGRIPSGCHVWLCLQIFWLVKKLEPPSETRGGGSETTQVLVRFSISSCRCSLAFGQRAAATAHCPQSGLFACVRLDIVFVFGCFVFPA